MAIAIMQPYVFPYIGYFQLVYAADVFVFYDDVNFINRGWINRNRILLNGKDHLFTIPCKDASQNRLIKDIEVVDEEQSMHDLLSTIKQAYNKAPYFEEVYSLVEQILFAPSTDAVVPDLHVPSLSNRSISGIAINSVTSICDYLGLHRTFKTSSELYDNQELKKADRLIDICHKEGITDYINASGGKEIYTKEYFRENGISLSFLNSELYEYPQFKNEFVPWLSIIDVLMFNSREDIVNKILPSYHLD